MKKDKLAIFIYSLGPGGAEKVTTTLAQHLKKEFDITIVVMKNLISYELPKGVRVVVAPGGEGGVVQKLLGMVWGVVWLKKWSKKEGITTILAILNRPIWIASLAKFLGNTPRLIVAEHTMQSLWRKEEGFFFSLKQKAMSLLLGIPDGVVAISREIALDLERNFEIAPERLFTISNPFDTQNILEKGTLVRQKKGSVITAGTLKPLKNHRLLIEALALFERPPLTTILGQGELYGELLGLSHERQLADTISFEGFQANPYGYFMAHDIFVLTSYFEGLPTVIIEAMICGCAIVSTDCPSGPREILAPSTDPTHHITQGVEWGEFGVLVARDDKEALFEALRILLEDGDKLNHYKKMGIIRSQDFDQKHSIGRYAKVLKGDS
jgi:N-acetylgalactosamine-N,N'-diacetylbacillosaminyl-diphospho-undecaprenol 4-alpha-N-acetylgalactosaminyltransferase